MIHVLRNEVLLILIEMLTFLPKKITDGTSCSGIMEYLSCLLLSISKMASQTFMKVNIPYFQPRIFKLRIYKPKYLNEEYLNQEYLKQEYINQNIFNQNI